MWVEARADFEEAYPSFYIAFRGTAAKPGGCSQEAGLSAGITLLCGIGGYRLLSDTCFGRAHFRLSADDTCHFRADFRYLPGSFSCDVGVALPFQRQRLALAAAFD
jgi:hypothetical protein